MSYIFFGGGGGGITRGGAGIERPALAVLPAHNSHLVRHIAGHLAPQDGVVSVHNVLIAGLCFIWLMHHCRGENMVKFQGGGGCNQAEQPMVQVESLCQGKPFPCSHWHATAYQSKLSTPEN
jgi:hypothetical protein